MGKIEKAHKYFFIGTFRQENGFRKGSYSNTECVAWI